MKLTKISRTAFRIPSSFKRLYSYAGIGFYGADIDIAPYKNAVTKQAKN